MSNKVFLTHQDIQNLCNELSESLASILDSTDKNTIKCYPIPRGGVPVAYVIGASEYIEIVDDPKLADFFVDDIIDSGSTLLEFRNEFPETPFFALINKLEKDCEYKDSWVVFPWENSAEKSIEDNIIRLLQFCGEDTTRGGLAETPKRVAKAWQAWTSGYGQKPADVMKVFKDGSDDCDEMVIVRDIPFYSHCEHHMAPFFGTATIAYIPNGSIVGLSKLSRLLDIFAKRLQVQERLTNQIADSLVKELDALGCGVIIKARHMCMESRGVCKQGHHTITSALRGVLKENQAARQEFMMLANS